MKLSKLWYVGKFTNRKSIISPENLQGGSYNSNKEIVVANFDAIDWAWLCRVRGEADLSCGLTKDAQYYCRESYSNVQCQTVHFERKSLLRSWNGPISELRRSLVMILGTNKRKKMRPGRRNHLFDVWWRLHGSILQKTIEILSKFQKVSTLPDG